MNVSMKTVVMAVIVAAVVLSASILIYLYGGFRPDKRLTALDAKEDADELVAPWLTNPILLSVRSEKALEGGSETWIFNYCQPNETANQEGYARCRAVQVRVKANDDPSIVEDAWNSTLYLAKGRETLHILVDSDEAFELACADRNVSSFLEQHEEYLLTMEASYFWGGWPDNTTSFEIAWNLFFNADLRGHEGAEWASINVDVGTGAVLRSNFHEHGFLP